MRSISTLAVATGGLAFMLAMSGCVHFTARSLVPEWTASSHTHQQENHGLSVAARALGKGKPELQFIGRPIRSQGYFPVVLFFENLGDAAFMVRRRGLRLETKDHQIFHASSMYEVYEDLKYSRNSALWGLPLGIVPAFVLGEKIDKQNEAFLNDLREKAFRDIRIWKRPRLYNCVMFFKVGSKRALKMEPTDATISIEVEHQETGKETDSLIQFRLVPEEPLE